MKDRNQYSWGLVGLVVATAIGLTGLHASFAPLRLELEPLAAAATMRQKATSRRILVTVTDTGGRPILDIDPDDVVIRESGELRDILSVHVADYPIVIVLDNGRDANREFEAIRRAASRFVGRVGRRPIAIAAANPPRIVAGFDDTRATLIQRVDKLKKRDSVDGLFQALVTAARATQETGAPFAAVVAVVANPKGGVPAGFPAPVLDSGATVHVVVQQKPSSGPHQTIRQTMETLADLVNETHGQFITIYSPESYQLALDRLADQLSGELIVEYIVPAGSPPASDVRLSVRMSGGKVNTWGVSPR